jgi:hypothetical protein
VVQYALTQPPGYVANALRVGDHLLERLDAKAEKSRQMSSTALFAPQMPREVALAR